MLAQRPPENRGCRRSLQYRTDRNSAHIIGHVLEAESQEEEPSSAFKCICGSKYCIQASWKRRKSRFKDTIAGCRGYYVVIVATLVQRGPPSVLPATWYVMCATMLVQVGIGPPPQAPSRVGSEGAGRRSSVAVVLVQSEETGRARCGSIGSAGSWLGSRCRQGGGAAWIATLDPTGGFDLGSELEKGAAVGAEIEFS